MSDLESAGHLLSRLARVGTMGPGAIAMIKKDRADSAMRALMVVVADECISENRAREIAGMTHEEQREHWRRGHKQAMADVRTAAIEECARLARAYLRADEFRDSYLQELRALANPGREEPE